MSRRAAKAPVNYTVDQEAWSVSEPDDQTGARSTRPKRAATEASKKRGRLGTQIETSSSKNTAAKTRRTSKSKRPKIEEIPATQPADESADEFDLPPSEGRPMSTPMTVTKQLADATIRSTKAASESVVQPKAKRGRKQKEIKKEIPETQIEQEENEAQASSHLARATKAPKQPRPAKRDLVPATQGDNSMDVDGLDQSSPAKKRRTSLKIAESKQAAGMSDHERNTGGAEATRKLNDVTRRFDALEVRYKKLRDVGVTEAQANYAELRRRTDERQKASETLISNLRTELAVQSAQAAEVASQRSEISDLNALSEKLKVENKSLESSLSSAQAEIRALQAKLAAERGASEQRMAPSSAVKNRVNGRQLPGTGAPDTHKTALKEQLYGDLTGLIIRDVKRREDEDGDMDVYDCIQTGRNGSECKVDPL